MSKELSLFNLLSCHSLQFSVYQWHFISSDLTKTPIIINDTVYCTMNLLHLHRVCTFFHRIVVFQAEHELAKLEAFLFVCLCILFQQFACQSCSLVERPAWSCWRSYLAASFPVFRWGFQLVEKTLQGAVLISLCKTFWKLLAQHVELCMGWS